MWSTTQAFDQALQEISRTWRSKVEVLYAGEVVSALDVVLDGKVSIDDVAVRRQADVTIADPDGFLTPREARDLLSPKGTELRLWRGLDVASAATSPTAIGRHTEWVPLGVFGLSVPEVKVGENSGTTVSLKAHDRVNTVKLRRFDKPWVIAKGTPTTTAIASIVTSRLSVPVRISPSGTTTPEVVYEALSDPWAAVQELAAADSLVAFFDPMGTLVIGPDVDSETGVKYEVGERSLLLSTSRAMDASETYSGVIVTGEHPDEKPIRVELWDTDPASPTYYLGPFGKRPFGFSSELMTSVAQASKAAATILPRVKRIPQTATMTTVGHVGHDVGDVVEVVDPRTSTSGRWRVAGGSVPLRPGLVDWKLEELDA